MTTDSMRTNTPSMFALPALVAVLLLGGCSGIPQFKSPLPDLKSSQLDLPPAALPDYAVGELYVYDNGRTETVIAREGDLLTWRTNNGVVRETYRNFVIPYLNWQTATRRGTSKTDADPELLWPLSVGSAGKFNFVRTAKDNDGGNPREYKQAWQCNVEDTEVVQIALGSFDTFRIVCHRYNGDIWRQTRTYNYAPSVGHYVLRQDSYRSGPSGRRELVSYGFNSAVFSPDQQQALTRLVQQTLSDNENGQITYWSGVDGRPRIAINPLSRETNSAGLLCRRYEGTFTDRQRIRTNSRYACRRADGVWIHSSREQK